VETGFSPIADYALIGDGHSAALVSRDGSIDWCCLPRFDAGSAFGRLLDPDRGGYCSIRPSGSGPWESTREYLDGTLVLATTFRGPPGEAKLTDCFALRDGVGAPARREILRVIEGRRGAIEFEVRIAPRFDYGEVRPCIRRSGRHVHTAIGGNDALVVRCDQPLEEEPAHELAGRLRIATGDRVGLSLSYCRPEAVEAD
jgi:GH15 family glucan-1,4-alpha-glucosidase